MSREGRPFRLIRTRLLTRNGDGGQVGAKRRGFDGDGGGRRLGGGQRRAHSLPRGAARHVPARVAAGVHRRRHLCCAGLRRGSALDPVLPRGGVVARRVDGGLPGLRALYHFLLPGSDNAFTQPPGAWRTTFGVSAVLLLPLQGMGCLAGLWTARVLSRPMSDGRARPVGSPAGRRRTPGRSHR